MRPNNIEIVRLANEIQTLCGDLPLGKRLRVANMCRRIRLRAKGLPDIEPAQTPSDIAQKTLILEYLQLGHPLTAIEALRFFGCARLGARIWDLKHDRKDPKNIVTEMIQDKNTGKRYASYKLIDSES